MSGKSQFDLMKIWTEWESFKVVEPRSDRLIRQALFVDNLPDEIKDGNLHITYLLQLLNAEITNTAVQGSKFPKTVEWRVIDQSTGKPVTIEVPTAEGLIWGVMDFALIKFFGLSEFRKVMKTRMEASRVNF